MNNEDRREVQRWTADLLKEHFEAVLREQNRALEQANEEREKSAAVLRGSLSSMIELGDKALERHIDQQIKEVRSALVAQAKLIDQAFSSSEKAITKAEEATERRLALLNEFRAQQGDESKKYAPREIVDQMNGAVQERLSKVENQTARLYGGLALIAVAVPIATAIIVSLIQ